MRKLLMFLIAALAFACSSETEEGVVSQTSALVPPQQALYSDFTSQFASTSFGTLTETPPSSSATTTTGWTPGKTGAGFFSTIQRGVERQAITFLSAVEPTKPPRSTAGNALVYGPLTGTYTAGDWDFSTSVVAATRGGASGRMRVRVRKGPDLNDGFTAVDMSPDSYPLSTVVSLTTSTPQTSSGLVPVTQNLTLSNEYIFVQFAWEVTAAANNVNTDVLVRRSTTPVVVTTDFTP